MRRIIVFVCLAMSIYVSGQSDSTNVLFKSPSIKIRPQFSIGYQASAFNHSTINSIDFGFGLNVNTRYFLGIYANISGNSPKNIAWGNNPIDPSLENSLSFIEGGGIAGYHFKPYKAVHLSAYTKFSNVHIENNEGPITVISDDAFAFIPELEAELNLTKAMRLGLSIGYRFTRKNKLFFQQNTSNSFVFTAILKFGRFSR